MIHKHSIRMIFAHRTGWYVTKLSLDLKYSDYGDPSYDSDTSQDNFLQDSAEKNCNNFVTALKQLGLNFVTMRQLSDNFGTFLGQLADKFIGTTLRKDQLLIVLLKRTVTVTNLGISGNKSSNIVVGIISISVYKSSIPTSVSSSSGSHIA